MTQLNQIIAVEKGVKADVAREVTDAYHAFQKPALLSGITRTYRPNSDEGDQLPPEQTLLQVRSGDVIDEVSSALTRLFDVVATKEWGNQQATADVVVDSQTLVQAAPVPYLLFLEKQLVDLRTFIGTIPTLDPSEEWSFSENDNAYRTPVISTHRSKKVPRVLVKAPATDKHQADTEVWHEDVVVGNWETVKFSGALPATRVKELQERVTKLREAVKVAREEANGTQVTQQTPGQTVLGYLFS